MAALALCQYLRIFVGGSTYHQWQNYFVGQTVEGYVHRPFSAGGIEVSVDGDQSSMTVTLPATAENHQIVEAAIAGAHLVEIQIYSIPTSDTSGPSTKSLVAQYIGEVIAGSSTETELTIEIGSSLDPVGAQVPPRKFTTTLIGEPPRL